MKITIPDEILKSLPEPDPSDGVIRVTVGIQVSPDGIAEMVEINDMPLPTGEVGAEEPNEVYAAADEASAQLQDY